MKKMVFKLVSISLLACICLLTFFGCSNKTNKNNKQDYFDFAISTATFPLMTQYSLIDYTQWHEDRQRQLNQEPGYKDGMSFFFKSSAPVFLNRENGKNALYSPLSLYFALAMLAETAKGNSRQYVDS